MKKIKSSLREAHENGTLITGFMLVAFLAGFAVLVALVGHSQAEHAYEREQRQAEVDAILSKNEVSTVEHQVDVVQEPAPQEAQEDIFGDSIEPMPDEYYEALELLAHLIYSEVGSDGEESMYYAGSVVLNRIKNSEYPDNLYDVIYQRGQYQVTWNGGLYKETPSDIAYEVAADLLNEGSVTPEEVIYQAEFKQGSGVYEKIGNTYYCYQ